MMPHPLDSKAKGRGAGRRRAMWTAITAAKSGLCSRTKAHPSNDVELSTQGLLQAISDDGWEHPTRSRLRFSTSHFARMLRQEPDVRSRVRCGSLVFRCGCADCRTLCPTHSYR